MLKKQQVIDLVLWSIDLNPLVNGSMKNDKK